MLVLSQNPEQDIVIVHQDRPNEEIIISVSKNDRAIPYKRIGIECSQKYNIFRRNVVR